MKQETKGYLIPKEIAKMAGDLFGKIPEKLTTKQLNHLMKTTGKAIIDPTGELLQKIGRANRGIDKEKIDTRMAMKYGGYNKGIFTDSFILISDPEIAKANYEKLWLDDATKGAKKLVKEGTEIPLQELIETFRKCNLNSVKDNEKDFPDCGFIINGIFKNKLKMRGYYADREDYNNVVLSTGRRFIVVNADKFAFLKKHFPDAELRSTDLGSNISLAQFIQNDKVVGAVSPLNIENKNIPSEFKN